MRLSTVTLVLALATNAYADNQVPELPPARGSDLECSQERALNPQQDVVGHQLDGHPAYRKPLQPGAAAVLIHCPSSDPNETPAMRLRRQLCSASDVVVGTVTSRRFLLSPRKKQIFGEYELQVEESIKAGAPLATNARITLVRPGGAVCTAAGRLDSIDQSQMPLTVGQRYLLFLTHKPEAGRYLTSSHDYILAEQARLAHSHDHTQDAMLPGELLGLLRSVSGPCE